MHEALILEKQIDESTKRGYEAAQKLGKYWEKLFQGLSFLVESTNGLLNETQQLEQKIKDIKNTRIL